MTNKQWVEVRKNFQRGSIEYRSLYLMLFASFNEWYALKTHSYVSADALATIVDDTTLWRPLLTNHDSQLISHMRKLHILTTLSPLPLRFKDRWEGKLRDAYDWEGLVWLWYAVRCIVSHGQSQYSYSHLDTVIVYAHASLSIYMSKVLLIHDQNLENDACLPLYETKQTVYNNLHKS